MRPRWVIVIADGAGDRPLEALGGRTPLEAARTPNLDALAVRGDAALGTAVTTPPGWEAGSDVCSMDLLGYDPRAYHTGRAPLEAAAMGLTPGRRDWIFRLNLVTVGEAGGPDEGLMLDHSAGAITDAEARTLVEAIGRAWAERCPEATASLTLRHGVSYRSIVIDAGGRDYGAVRTTPPHEIPRQPWAAAMPAARGPAGEEAAATLRGLMTVAGGVLAEHPVNRARKSAGKRPANAAWMWGQGTAPSMPAFAERFGLRGAMITAVDLLAGIAALMGWTRLRVPGVTSYHDTDYAAQGRATLAAVGLDAGDAAWSGAIGVPAEGFDIVCCHVESPDEASHQGDWATKVAGIEAIDTHVIGPVRAALERAAPGALRLLVLPDHYTLVSTRRHDATAVPWMMVGVPGLADRAAGVAGTGRGPARFTESHAGATGRVVHEGHTLMDLFVGRAVAAGGGGR